MITKYEIYALKYAGPLKRPGALVMWNKDWDKIVNINYYFWCIRGGKETIIVDAGVTPTLAIKLNLPTYSNPIEILSRINIDANKIIKVVLTHLHFDHDDGVSLFPNSTFYLQEEEYFFWVKNPLANYPPIQSPLNQNAINYLKALEGTDRLFLLRGDQELLPGIECLLTPGHSVANQSVAVHTHKGTAVIGSDCAHLFNNYKDGWPSIFFIDLKAWMRSNNKLKSKVSSMDLLFPGHDPILSENYPKIAEGITQLC